MGIQSFYPLALFLLTACAPSPEPRVIECTVPGTEVYYRDQLLGVVPVDLRDHADTLVTMGVTKEQIEAGPMPGGYGEGFYFDQTYGLVPPITFRAPEPILDQYLVLETPWGKRSKLGSPWVLDIKNMETQLEALHNGDGASLTLSLAEPFVGVEESLFVEGRLTNTSFRAIVGATPNVQFLLRGFEGEEVQASSPKHDFGSEAFHLEPGGEFAFKLEIPAPDWPGHYSLLAMFHIHTGVGEDYLVGEGAIYSNSVLVEVRE